MALKLAATVKLNFNAVEAMTRVNDAVMAGTREIFGEIVSTAVDNSPELTKATSERYPGELRDSISLTVRRVKAGVKAKVFTEFYGAFLELGTAKMAATPFLWPALEQHIANLGDAVKEQLDAK